MYPPPLSPSLKQKILEALRVDVPAKKCAAVKSQIKNSERLQNLLGVSGLVLLLTFFALVSFFGQKIVEKKNAIDFVTNSKNSHEFHAWIISPQSSKLTVSQLQHKFELFTNATRTGEFRNGDRLYDKITRGFSDNLMNEKVETFDDFFKLLIEKDRLLQQTWEHYTPSPQIMVIMQDNNDYFSSELEDVKCPNYFTLQKSKKWIVFVNSAKAEQFYTKCARAERMQIQHPSEYVNFKN